MFDLHLDRNVRIDRLAADTPGERTAVLRWCQKGYP